MELLNSILYDTVYHSAPIILCVIGGIFAYKANVLNIALEGMMLNGAFISVLVEYLTGSVALAVIAAIVTTLLWGLVFSFLGITCNGNVIVIGLGINLIVPAIAKFVLKVMELANISLQDVGVADFKINIPGIKSIPLIGGIVSGHPIITYLAFIGIAAAAILMYKTKFGIYVRVVGENEDSAISLGLKTQKYKYIAVLIGAFFPAQYYRTFQLCLMPNVPGFSRSTQFRYPSSHALPNSSFISTVSFASNALMSSKIDADGSGASNL